MMIGNRCHLINGVVQTAYYINGSYQSLKVNSQMINKIPFNSVLVSKLRKKDKTIKYRINTTNQQL